MSSYNCCQCKAPFEISDERMAEIDAELDRRGDGAVVVAHECICGFREQITKMRFLPAEGGQFGCKSFAALAEWFRSFPDQANWRDCDLRGEDYVTFSEKALARPADVEIVQALAASNMQQRLREYFAGRAGRIYWREELETSVTNHTVSVDGNSDKNWKIVHAYCRVHRALKDDGTIEIAA